jgi:GMP synthase-like glutamine amidotransferase
MKNNNICVLEADLPDKRLIDEYGTYTQMIKNWLDKGGQVDEYLAVNVRNKGWQELINIENIDIFIITGSRYSVNDDSVWIDELSQFIKYIWDKTNKKMLGICFGHQIIAKAMNGKVAKNKYGWNVGANKYNIKKPYSAYFDNLNSLDLLVIHQEQIVKKPQIAKLIADNDRCKYGVLLYANRFLTIQAHPEFVGDFLQELINKRDLTANITGEDIFNKIDSKQNKMTISFVDLLELN